MNKKRILLELEYVLGVSDNEKKFSALDEYESKRFMKDRSWVEKINIHKEYELIKQKKSKLSSKKREYVIYLIENK